MSFNSNDYEAVDDIKKKSPWGQLALCFIGCFLCAGLMPGMALYIEIFAETGIYSSVCMSAPPGGKASSSRLLRQSQHHKRHVTADGGEMSGKRKKRADKEDEVRSFPCTNQYSLLTSQFSNGMFLTMLLNMPTGLLFDKYGPRRLGFWSAVVIFVGFLLLLVSVIGAELGYDSVTSPIFFAVVVVTNAASFANGFAIFGLMFHFPGLTTFIIALAMASYNLSAMQAAFLQILLETFSLSTSKALVVLMAFVLVGVVLCRFCTPTQAEYRKAAEDALGMPLPQPPEKLQMWKGFKEANSIFLGNPGLHLTFLIHTSITNTVILLYSGMATTYGQMLFGTETEGLTLSTNYVYIFTLCAGILSPIVIYFSEKLGEKWSLMTLLWAMLGFLFVALSTVGISSWTAQYACIVCLSFWTSNMFTVFSRYATVYSIPSRFGGFQALLLTYGGIISIVIFSAATSFMSSLPQDARMIQIPIYVLGGVGLVLGLVWTAYLQATGLPDLPVMSENDKKELVSSFGATTFEECEEVVGMTMKQLFKLMSSADDPAAFTSFLTTLDKFKIGEILKTHFDPSSTLVPIKPLRPYSNKAKKASSCDVEPTADEDNEFPAWVDIFDHQSIMQRNCLCGACKVWVIGNPVEASACFCESCRHALSGPNICQAMPYGRLGCEGKFYKHDFKDLGYLFRWRCATCSSLMLTDLPGFGMTLVPAKPHVFMQYAMCLQDSNMSVDVSRLNSFMGRTKTMKGTGERLNGSMSDIKRSVDVAWLADDEDMEGVCPCSKDLGGEGREAPLKFKVEGQSDIQLFCHGPEETIWLGNPIGQFVVTATEKISVVSGEVRRYARNGKVYRNCKRCGAPFAIDFPANKMSMVNFGFVNRMFKPTGHMHWPSQKNVSLLDIFGQDGLPKFEGYISELGGTSCTLAE